MIPFSFHWDTQKRSILLKWDGFFSLGWKRGNVLMRIFGFSIPLNHRKKEIRFPMRWIYLKEAFSFLKEWRLKKMEGTFSLPDPMVNGLLCGLIGVFESGKTGRKSHISINFMGENRFSGEAILPVKVFIGHLRRWVLLFLRENRRKKP